MSTQDKKDMSNVAKISEGEKKHSNLKFSTMTFFVKKGENKSDQQGV